MARVAIYLLTTTMSCKLMLQAGLRSIALIDKFDLKLLPVKNNDA